jgi:hypothetical protein
VVPPSPITARIGALTMPKPTHAHD